MSPKSTLDTFLEQLDCIVPLNNRSGHDLGTIEEMLVDVPEHVLELEGRKSMWHISLVLTSDDHLRQLHAEHLGDDSVTDVMSFLYSSEIFEFVTFGEIVISVDRAIEQATEAGWSLKQELSFLVIHGMLHLCDWLDDTDEAREAMHRRQREIMESLARP